MNAKGSKKAVKKKNNKHELPEPIKKGEILTDLKKNQWVIGSSIGVGGFGEIYEAAPLNGKSKNCSAVVKIEPHGNGPLFVEMHFYMRNANSNEIDQWKKEKKLPHLGMPKFLASGSHDYNNTKYRFLVVEKYGNDLWKLFNENGRIFPEHTVYNIALQVVDVLQYIHYKKYIHGDVKGGNLLLDLKSPKFIYLVDFGLACHYTTKDEYKPDPKKANDGTPEYESRDAHNGVPTMRGDLEVLAYNIIQWLCGSLPWEKNLTNLPKIKQQKEEAFKDLDAFLNKCFVDKVPETVVEFMQLVNSIKFREEPNYSEFKNILLRGLKKLNKTPYGELEFVSNKNPKESKVKSNAASMKEKSLKVGLVRLTSNDIKSNNNDLANDLDTHLVCDQKFNTGTAAINHILDNIDFDSDSEYDVQIKKRKKKEENITKSNTPKKLANCNKKNDVESEDESKEQPRNTKGRSKKVVNTTPNTIQDQPNTRPTRAAKSKALTNNLKSFNSEEDLFND